MAIDHQNAWEASSRQTFKLTVAKTLFTPAGRRRIHGSGCCTARADAVPKSGLKAVRLAQQRPFTPSASAVADGRELLGQATAEGRHVCKEA
jgi:hypothetical protein